MMAIICKLMGTLPRKPKSKDSRSS